MKKEIQNNIDDPIQLERLYRSNKQAFKNAFNELYPYIEQGCLAAFWNTRLNYTMAKTKEGSGGEFFFVLLAALISAIIAKLPVWLPVYESFFYTRDLAFIIFPALIAYFAWKNKLPVAKKIIIGLAIVTAAAFINMLPDKNSDLLQLSCIHLPIVLWAVLGYSFTTTQKDVFETRMRYLVYNGNLVVMSGLIVIAGGILSVITIGLFDLIELNINKFYFDYVVVFGLSATPIVATYLVQTNPELVGKVSPVIARIFSPLVLVMLIAYLVAITYTKKDPFNDREFLLLFNVLLLGVLAIIFFSIAGYTKATEKPAETWVLLLLSIVSIIVNGIALSAIIFRISSWGITPNRVAVLGGNLIIIINLILVAFRLLKTTIGKGSIKQVEYTIAFYLPLYAAWATIVTFIFPWIFHNK